MKISLQEWGKRNYSPAPAIRTLRDWVRTHQIDAEKVGKTWMVDERATRTPLIVNLADYDCQSTPLSARAQHILLAA